ncbi:Importin subunit beta-1, partial [Ananas comosus]
ILNMAMEITQILLAAQSPDAQIRTAAEESLKQFQEQNLPHFLLALSVELSNEQKPPASRRLAGIILKNSLDAKDSIRKEELTQRWVSVDPAIKFQIKESLLRTLGSPVAEARHTSSQVTAKVASIEIPRREWQELIAKLLTYMTQQDTTSSLKQATLEALGYVCEEVSPQDLQQDQVNAVLTAVVQGMNQKEHSSEVRLAAVKALYNALDFAQTNFENELERAFIIKVVCETAVSKESEIRQAAFECLVSIASTYYEILEPFMPSLFNLTSNAVRGDEEPVALQAIEFWSTVCDEEIAIQEEYGGADEGSSSLHHRFIEKALPSLVPMLLETLLKQEEDQDQDDSMWNLSMAGGTCLGLVARTVGDAVVPLVMPFVQENIMKADWHNREAATFAFGSILEVIIQKLSNSDSKALILQSADQMMILFLRVFACRSSSVHEEAMLAIGALAYATGSDFAKYMPEFYRYLEMGLQNFEEYQGFKNTKAELLMPYAGNLLKFTEAVFRDKNRDEGVTRAAVAVMGDLADALGPTTKALFKESHFYSDFLEESFQSDDDQLRETATWAQGMIRRVFLS